MLGIFLFPWNLVMSTDLDSSLLVETDFPESQVTPL